VKLLALDKFADRIHNKTVSVRNYAAIWYGGALKVLSKRKEIL
jgi:hypothetical protein